MYNMTSRRLKKIAKRLSEDDLRSLLTYWLMRNLEVNKVKAIQFVKDDENKVIRKVYIDK